MQAHVTSYLKQYMSQFIKRYLVSTTLIIRYEIMLSSITSLDFKQELTVLCSSIFFSSQTPTSQPPSQAPPK